MSKNNNGRSLRSASLIILTFVLMEMVKGGQAGGGGARGGHFLRPLRAPEGHFLRSLRAMDGGASVEDNNDDGHVRQLRSDHFLRSLRSGGNAHFLRTLRSVRYIHNTPYYCTLISRFDEQNEGSFNEDEGVKAEHIRPVRSGGHFLRTLRSNNPFTDSDDYAGFFDEDEEAGNSGEVIDALLKRGKVTAHFLRYALSNYYSA